jgi:phospholipase/carboxylesterase
MTAGQYVKLRPMIELETGANPVASVIWLPAWAPTATTSVIVPRAAHMPLRCVPHAPVRPVTINNGARMRAWYDIFQFGGGSKMKRDTILPALVEGFIQNEKGRLPGRLFPGRGHRPADGIALPEAGRPGAFYLPPLVQTRPRKPQNQASHLHAHGTGSVIPLQKAKLSREVLEQRGYKSNGTNIRCHTPLPQEIGDISASSLSFNHFPEAQHPVVLPLSAPPMGM